VPLEVDLIAGMTACSTKPSIPELGSAD